MDKKRLHYCLRTAGVTESRYFVQGVGRRFVLKTGGKKCVSLWVARNFVEMETVGGEFWAPFFTQ